MRFKVLEPFAGTIHRYYKDDVVEDYVVEGDSPLSCAEWVERGMLGAVSPDEEDLTALQAEAVDLGIEIDGRWGAARLRQEIEAAKAVPPEVAEAAATMDDPEPEKPRSRK